MKQNIEIIPAILPKRFNDIEKDVSEIVGVAPMAQIDICDGIYVPNRTWPFEGHGAKDEAYLKDTDMQALVGEESGMPAWETVDYELDLMVRDPATLIPNIMCIGPKRIVVHFTQTDLVNGVAQKFFDTLDPFYTEQIEFGLAMTSDIDTEVVKPFIQYIKFVQCMGIKNVGFQNQEFNEDILDTICSLHGEYPDLPISVDGAVNEDTIENLIDAGATRLVIGSAIWESETPGEMVRHFKRVAYNKVNGKSPEQEN